MTTGRRVFVNGGSQIYIYSTMLLTITTIIFLALFIREKRKGRPAK